MEDILFSTTDPLGRLVYLTKGCYQLHILMAHPDLDDLHEIEQAIRLAEYIAQDSVDPQRIVYYKTYQRRPQRWFIKVVVDQENEVVTAYRVKRIKQSEMILWQR